MANTHHLVFNPRRLSENTEDRKWIMFWLITERHWSKEKEMQRESSTKRNYFKEHVVREVFR